MTPFEFNATINLNETRRVRRQLQYFIGGVEYGFDELENLYEQINCGAAQYLVRVELQAVVQSPEARLRFFEIAYGYALADQLKNFAIVPCGAATFENVRLDAIPAPSPPPPRDDWAIPPSPPVFQYELLTFSSALASSGGVFLCACLCCVVLGGAKTSRGRHTSRFFGTKLLRVDRMPYDRRERERRGVGYFHDVPPRGDIPRRARDLLAIGASQRAWQPVVTWPR